MSVLAYATSRGISHTAVQRAIREGRLTAASIVRDARGSAKIRDPRAADREWAAHTEPRDDRKWPPARPRGESQASALARATQRERQAKARLAELEYDRRAGKLVRAADVERRWAAICTQIRTAFLGLPTQAKQRLPHLTVSDLQVLEGLIRERLEELAGNETSERDRAEAG